MKQPRYADRFLLRADQIIQRALDPGDHAGGNKRVACRCLQLVMAEQCLDLADIDTRLQEMCRKRMAQRVQRHRLADAGCIGRLLKQPPELAWREMLT